MAVKNNRKFYIQVTDDFSNHSPIKRKISPFISLNDQIQKIIVVNKPIDEMIDENGFIIIIIIIISASDFMLRFIK